MKTVEKKVYYCEFCKKHSLSAGSMSRHERFCTQNPNNWHKCFHYCRHLQKDKIEIPVRDGNDEYTVLRTEFKCGVTGQKMYSFKAEKKRRLVIAPDEIRMPLTCANFSSSESECDSYDDFKFYMK